MNFQLWLAQGFGSGRVPFGPGTWGSLVGLLWFAVLLGFRSPVAFCIGIVLSILVSVWACGGAETILGQKDPGSVVLDEIIAVPLCFGAWLGAIYFQKGFWPAPDYFFSNSKWPMTIAVFVLFRIADIAKPWPVYQSQFLPRGWGVTMDDVVAALYVNIVILIALPLKREWF